MAQALSFLINAAGAFVPLGLAFKEPPSDLTCTTVQIDAGAGDPSCEGNVPHIAVWDNNGNRIGQYHPKSKDKIQAGQTTVLTVANNENGNEQADPSYVMLSNLDDDAICISAVLMSNMETSGTFFGDTGYTCGQSWFLSSKEVGSNLQKPKCVWLDAAHTNGINARALSFHLNDLAPATDKLVEYQNEPATLCQSTPRFSFWGNLLPDGVIPFFNPPLEYNPDSTDGGEGADKNPASVIDKPNQYNKAVYLNQGEPAKTPRKIRRRSVPSSNANHNPEHLIITDHLQDDIREVCEHPNSYGYDIVSTVQKLYCDMENKQLYNVCNGQDFKDNCFDSDAKIIVPRGGAHPRTELAASISPKAYTSVGHWTYG